MEKILITGGAGFIGHHLVNRFINLDFEVTVFDALIDFSAYADPSGRKCFEDEDAPANSGAVFVKGDVRDRGHLDRLLTEIRPDIVIHLAGIPLSRTANKLTEDAVSININGTANLLEAMRLAGSVSRFVYISSSFVYGDFS